MKRKSIIFFSLLYFAASQLSCIEEAVLSSFTEDFETQALILREIEQRGDYINSQDLPAFKTASDVFNNLQDCIILDVRTSEEFNSGHINDAINIHHTTLFDYVTNSYEVNKDYIIISGSGQSASYYASLFRLYGLKNIYTLQFGMASWHSDFAGLIIDKTQSPNLINIFNNIDYPKPKFTNLPKLTKPDNSSIENFYTERIKTMFSEGFAETSTGNISAINTVDFEHLSVPGENEFYICLNRDIFFFGKLGDLNNPGHPKGTVLYECYYPGSLLKSTSYLQTLPADKTLILYSFSGQLSAMAVAQLRLLGYNAKSILFGAHAMFYERLLNTLAYSPFVFQKKLVVNYPYVK
ncbi:MAG: hypothetical protein A2068_04115 [Ignavibacteria bacterium GWB2_35_6b]|nr:MAG: hypothetical protein A2068_04115 [Ignavibacteria bacterium GWB2_35_6b]